MADKDFSSEFKKMVALQNQINSGAEKLEQNLKNQIEMQKDILKVKEDILNSTNKINELNERISNNLKEEKRIEDEINKLIKSGVSKTSSKVKALEKELDVVKKLKAANGEKLSIAEEELEYQKQGLETMRAMVKESNKLKSVFRSTGNFMKKWGFENLKKYGVFEMDKEIRNAARSMGIGNRQFSKFSDNIADAARSTGSMGITAGKLAKMQQDYSKEVGRSVVLTKDGMVAMAEMAEGTGLAEGFAVGMASAMDNFGSSVATSRDLVAETMNIADSMGVNSAKAAESMQKNLRFAQKYNFKNGVKGLAKMTSEALKLKIDLDSISGMAEKVFRPEGAVKMAAQLQTMGGAFARMADPMQLMFKARNDFAGFAKDISKATSEFVEYNAENGTFDIKGGLAADRMREIANMTGIGVEKLQEMASQQKKIQMIGAVAPIGIDDKDMELVESFSEIGKDGKITINVGGDEKDIKKLTQRDIEELRKEKKSLDERAKQARTFAEVLDDFKDTLKTFLLPIARGLKDGLGKPLQEFMDDANKTDGLYETVKNFASGIGDFIGSVGPLAKSLAKFVADNPIKSLLTVMGLKAAPWIWRGVKLGIGFNRTASVSGGGIGGGGGGGGIMDYVTGRGGKGPGGMMRMMKAGAKRGGFRGAISGLGRGMGIGKGMGMAKGASTLLKGAGKGFAPLALLGAGMDAFTNFSDDELSGTDAILKTLDQNKGMALGAAIGSIIPGVGTMIGAGIGGLADLILPTIGDYGPKAKGYSMNDGIIKFNPKDKFMTMNDGMLMASTQEGKLDKAAKELSGGGDVNHKFDDIKINININATGIDDEIGKKMIDNTEFIRALNTKIREEASKVLSGGVLNPTPK